jgi:hypothetical protein
LSAVGAELRAQAAEDSEVREAFLLQKTYRLFGFGIALGSRRI